MPYVVIATDSAELAAEVSSVLPSTDFDVSVVTSGPAAIAAAQARTPDLVVVDMQVGSMGGVAICLELRLEHSANRIPEIPTLLILDRRADVFLARRAGTSGWILKPLEPIRLRKAIRTVLAGGVHEDDSFRPPTVPVPASATT